MTLAWFRRAALPLALGCLLSSCAAQSPTGGTAATAIEPDTFRELDGSLRATFARARSGVAGAIGPMVTVDGRTLTWWRASDPAWSRGSDASWRHTFDAKLFEQYALLRQVPLTVFQIASSQGGDKQKPASTYAARVRAALDALDTSVIPPAQLPDQRIVLQSSIDMLDRIAAGTEASTTDLDAFVQRTRPALIRNLSSEIAATIAALGVAVEEMRSIMRPGEWERVYIAVEGDASPQLARARYDYLARVLGQDAKGKRLFLMPSTSMHRGATFLRSVMTEDDLSRVFFEYPYAVRVP